MKSSSTQDIRWKQRFDSFNQAFSQLQEAVELYRERKLTNLESQGLIQAFEFTHEMAWNVIKDYFEYQGTQLITGSRDASREAFSKGLIKNGEAWMEMIASRNPTSHTYNKTIADEIIAKLVGSYFKEFSDFQKTMAKLSATK